MKVYSLIFLLFAAGCIAPRPEKTVEYAAATHAVTAVAQPTLVTREAPGFTAEAVMPDDTFAEISLSSFRGKYVILFFYPLDFTFVCPTEIVAFNDQLDAFKKINCEVLGVSTDSKYSHLAWRNTPKVAGGIGKIRYPLISDITKNIARSYGVLHDDAVALRGLFLIDPKGVVRHALVNDLTLGRSIDEAMRIVKAQQLIDQYGEFCPANWQPGDKSINDSKESMEEYFKK